MTRASSATRPERRAASGRRRAPKGLTLLEVMVSAAIVGIMGAGALSLLSHLYKEEASNRLKAIALADASLTLDRIVNSATVAAGFSQATTFCQLLQAANNPMDGGTVSGTCPELVSVNAPVAGSGGQLTRDVTITKQSGDLYDVVIQVHGERLLYPVTLKTSVSVGAP